ncbi:MAG: methylated-DNA--[protein]-cysteine S-methyltransferase [Opitutales bacterium]
MKQIEVQNYKTSIGELLIGSFEDQLCLMDYRYRRMRTTVDKRIQSTLQAEYVETDSQIIEETKKQLEEYLNKGRTQFDIPILFAGSDFQRSVWNALLQIPYGETRSYSELAESLGNLKAIRAVASANGANSMSILVPCHRIIESNGGLGGYAGGLSVKRKLINLESNGAEQTSFL